MCHNKHNFCVQRYFLYPQANDSLVQQLLKLVVFLNTTKYSIIKISGNFSCKNVLKQFTKIRHYFTHILLLHPVISGFL